MLIALELFLDLVLALCISVSFRVRWNMELARTVVVRGTELAA